MNTLLFSDAIPNPLSFPLTSKILSHCTAAFFQFKSRKPPVYFQSCIFLGPCWVNPSFSCVDSIKMSFPSSSCSPVRTIFWCCRLCDPHMLSKWISLHILHLGPVTHVFCSMLETKLLQWFILFCYPSSGLCSVHFYFPPFVDSACRVAKYATPLGEACCTWWCSRNNLKHICLHMF